MGFAISKEVIIDIAEFLDAVYGTQSGFVCINSIDEETGSLTIERWLSWPKEKKFAERYACLRSDEDVYLSVAVFSTEHRAKEDPLSVAQVVWADADTCAPENFRVVPSIVVQTSPGRWHCWWVLNESIPAERAERVAQRMSVAHAAQGCDRGFTRTKLLRVPGTTNTKHGADEVTATDSGERYSIERLEAAYADVELDRVVENLGAVPTPVNDNDLLDLETELDSHGLADLYTRKPEPGQSWSERLFRFELELFRIGFNPTQVFSVARKAACNKYDPKYAGEQTETGVIIPLRNNPDGVLWADVQKAYAEYLADQDVEVDEETSTTPGGASFLSIEERRFVEDNPCWIDRYTDWAMSRSTDGVPDYQRSLGYQLLSMVFGDRVVIPWKFGPMYPNLWVTIAGLSTLDKKTTAMNYMLGVLHKVEDLTQEQIDIGSDATAEALIQTLGKRDKQASLIYTDEIYDFFAELYAKNYRVGTIGNFTKLYGGEVPVVLRTGKDSGNRNRARTAFGFLGVGVKERIARVLNRDSFESGFLLRMTWTVADERRYKKGDADMEFGEAAPDGTYDSDMTELAVDLFERMERYDRERPTALRMSAEALERFNQFGHELHVASAHAQDKVLEGGMDRLRDSVAKAASLLAAYERLDEIDLYCVLAAIRQGEVWYKGLSHMLDAVSTSAFGHQQDTVLGFVVAAKNHEALESTIYSKFKFKPSEFNEIMVALTKQGKIKRVDGNRWRALV